VLVREFMSWEVGGTSLRIDKDCRPLRISHLVNSLTPSLLLGEFMSSFLFQGITTFCHW